MKIPNLEDNNESETERTRRAWMYSEVRLVIDERDEGRGPEKLFFPKFLKRQRDEHTRREKTEEKK